MRLPRKPATRVVAAVAVAAAALALAATAATRHVGAELEPVGASGPVKQAKPYIAAEIGWSVRDARIFLNGRDLTDRARRDGDRLILSRARLADGDYAVRVSGSTLGPLGRELSREWSFTVDTKEPALRASTDRYVRGRTAQISGETDPREQVTATVGATEVASASADERGRYRLRAPLSEGDNRVRLRVVDAAGNASAMTRTLTSDATPPELSLGGADRSVETASPTLGGRVVDDGPVQVEASVDGAEATTVEATDGRFEAPLASLTEGTHTVELRAEDGAGNTSRATHELLVDSTDEFGTATLGLGARGADARRLMELMREHGGYRGPVRAVLGAPEIDALRDYQRDEGLTADGLAGASVRAALLAHLAPRVLVDLSEFTVTLERGGTATSVYTAAVGQPEYPTPTGTYEIVDKQVDPVWTPPDSPWAAELSTIPPGPGNPLGTRWMGTSAPAIGLHGTYATESLGTAASHGCIRLSIEDAEELYDQIDLGTPVIIEQ